MVFRTEWRQKYYFKCRDAPVGLCRADAACKISGEGEQPAEGKVQRHGKERHASDVGGRKINICVKSARDKHLRCDGNRNQFLVQCGGGTAHCRNRFLSGRKNYSYHSEEK